jgi:vesicle-associated membrane protein 7
MDRWEETVILLWVLEIVAHDSLAVYFFRFRNFAYLQALALEFSKAYTKRKIKNCNAYAMDKEFGATVRSTMHYYNINHKRLSRDQQVERLLAQVEDMKSVLGRNLHLLLEREGKLDRLVEKSETAKRDSMVFKKRSILLKKQNQQRYYKFYALLTGLILAVIYTILIAYCGFRFQYCRARGGD